MNRKTVRRLVRASLAAVMVVTALSFVPKPAQLVEASPNNGNKYIKCGVPVYGKITTSDHYDFWRFNRKAGDKVNITMTRTSGNLDSMVVLWLKKDVSSGYKKMTLAGSAGGSSGAFISNFTLPKTGTYIIGAERVNTKGGTTTGNYKLTLTCSGSSSSSSSSSS